eukprot:2167688-Amphidinium_carterae.1
MKSGKLSTHFDPFQGKYLHSAAMFKERRVPDANRMIFIAKANGSPSLCWFQPCKREPARSSMVALPGHLV